MTSQHAGAPALVCALGSVARGRALYVSRRSLQRQVGRRSVQSARAFRPLSTLHGPCHLLFEQRSEGVSADAIDHAAANAAAQCRTSTARRLEKGRGEATFDSAPDGQGTKTADADCVHFMDDRFRPAIADPFHNADSKRQREEADASAALPPEAPRTTPPNQVKPNGRRRLAGRFMRSVCRLVAQLLSSATARRR